MTHVLVCVEHRDAEDHMYDAGGAGAGAGDTKRWAVGEGETVGELEICPGRGEEPGGAPIQRHTETTGQREAEQVQKHTRLTVRAEEHCQSRGLAVSAWHRLLHNELWVWTFQFSEFIMMTGQSSHCYFYSALYYTDCFTAALQW